MEALPLEFACKVCPKKHVWEIGMQATNLAWSNMQGKFRCRRYPYSLAMGQRFRATIRVSQPDDGFFPTAS